MSKNLCMLLHQKVPFPRAITWGLRNTSPCTDWTPERKVGEKNKNTCRRTRQMVSVLNPDKLAVNSQVFERILRQWKYLVKLFVLLFSSIKHLQQDLWTNVNRKGVTAVNNSSSFSKHRTPTFFCFFFF